MSRASCEPGVWKYQGMACALVAAARLASVATTFGRNFDPLIFFFPDLVLQSLLQLGPEHPARLLVEVPAQLQRFACLAQHDARARHFHAHAPRIELVARKTPALGPSPANGRISQAPAIAKPVPMASTTTASATNTQARPDGEIEQLRLRVRLKPPCSSRNASSRGEISRVGVLTEARNVPQESAPSQGMRLKTRTVLTPRSGAGRFQPCP